MGTGTEDSSGKSYWEAPADDADHPFSAMVHETRTSTDDLIRKATDDALKESKLASSSNLLTSSEGPLTRTVEEEAAVDAIMKSIYGNVPNGSEERPRDVVAVPVPDPLSDPFVPPAGDLFAADSLPLAEDAPTPVLKSATSPVILESLPSVSAQPVSASAEDEAIFEADISSEQKKEVFADIPVDKVAADAFKWQYPAVRASHWITAFPYILHLLLGASLAGVMIWEWYLSPETPLVPSDTELFSIAAIAICALFVLGVILPIIVWSLARTRTDETKGLFTFSLFKGALSTILVVALWFGALLYCDSVAKGVAVLQIF